MRGKEKASLKYVGFALISLGPIGAIAYSLVTLTDFEIPFAIATFGIWAGLVVLSSEVVEKRIEQNVVDYNVKLAKKGKSIKPRKLKEFNWPKAVLGQASTLFLIGSILFIADIFLNIQDIEILAFKSYDVLFYAGMFATIGAVVYSSRLFKFLIDRTYRPKYGMSHLARGFVVVATMPYSYYSVTFLYSLLVHSPPMNNLGIFLAITFILAIIGIIYLDYNVIWKDMISKPAVVLLSAPVDFVLLLLILLKLGVPI
ncbi:MAG TPA: hypothetical protein VNE86_06510 [Nitrososphaerales archaeon]|nr:hypothetical protein [Nitrososphaerales archaeon]